VVNNKDNRMLMSRNYRSESSLHNKRFCGVQEQTITFLVFGSRPIFLAGKTSKFPFLGLSLLPNPTETLATQASLIVAPWKFDVLKTSIFAVEESLLG